MQPLLLQLQLPLLPALLLDLLRDLNKRLGQTILMITHNPEAAVRMRLEKKWSCRSWQTPGRGTFPSKPDLIEMGILKH